MAEFFRCGNAFLWIAVAWALTFGIFCFGFFEIRWRERSWLWLLHQFWFNAIGVISQKHSPS